MTKTIIKFSEFFFTGFILVIMNLSSCGQTNGVTLENNKYKIKIDHQEYSKDSIYLYYVLETMLIKNIRPFTPAIYYNKLTKIYIDSILYSPDKRRIIVFIVNRLVKNSEANKAEYEYNAKYFFCERTQTGGTIKVFNYAPVGLDHYDNYNDVRKSLQELVFVRRSGERWNDQQNKYNMDDKRFWSSSEFEAVVANEPFTKLE